VWKAVETKARKIRIGKEKTKEEKNNESEEDSRRVENMG